MTYAFMSIEKIKNYGTMNSKCNHNLRKADVHNADPELTHLNESLIELPTKPDGSQMDYAEAVKERINSLPYYKTHKVRSDQVLAYEVLLTFTKDDSVDISAWKKRCMSWLNDTFNVAGDGKSNIINVEFHADESGQQHIHAIVVPVDERGHLNAVRFTGGHKAMTELQSSYADKMADLGIKRGVAGSSANHKTIRRMYASLNNAVELPEKLPEETIEEYRDRTLEDIKTRYAVAYKKISDKERASKRNVDIYRNDQMKYLNEELDRSVQKAKIKTEQEEQKCNQAKNRRDAYEEQCAEYEEQLNALTQQLFEVRFLEQERKDAKAYRDMNRGLDAMDDTEAVVMCKNMINEAIQLGAEIEMNEVEI